MDEAASVLYDGIRVLLALLEKPHKDLIPCLSTLEREERWEKPFGLTEVFSAESELTPQKKKRNNKGTHHVIHQWLSKRTLEEQNPPTATPARSGARAQDGLAPVSCTEKGTFDLQWLILPTALLGPAWEMRCLELAQGAVLIFCVWENSRHWSDFEAKA